MIASIEGFSNKNCIQIKDLMTCFPFYSTVWESIEPRSVKWLQKIICLGCCWSLGWSPRGRSSCNVGHLSHNSALWPSLASGQLQGEVGSSGALLDCFLLQMTSQCSSLAISLPSLSLHIPRPSVLDVKMFHFVKIFMQFS